MQNSAWWHHTLSLNHTNCLEQGTVRHTYGNLIHSIRLHLNPPLSFQTFHQYWKCAWGMLRQPCLNYSLTLWPASCIDTAVQPDTIAWGCNWLQLCVRLLQDDASQWNLNCGACECIVFVFRASPLSHSKLQGRAPLQLVQRLSITHGTSVTTGAGLGYLHCKWAAV